MQMASMLDLTAQEMHCYEMVGQIKEEQFAERLGVYSGRRVKGWLTHLLQYGKQLVLQENGLVERV